MLINKYRNSNDSAMLHMNYISQMGKFLPKSLLLISVEIF